MVVAPESLSGLNAEQLRELARDLIGTIAHQDQHNAQQMALHGQAIAVKDREILYRQAKIEQLTHKMAVLKGWKFGRSREQLGATQASLLDETIDADIAAIEQELQDLASAAKTDTQTRQQPKRAALPAELPRVDIQHEPDSTTCQCGCQLKRIGQDVSERLDYTPGVFTVERHICGKWACAKCETLIQAPVPAQIIDKGIPTSGLLA
jgi:transposase